MNLKKQKDPAQKDINFILSLLSSGKFTEAKKEVDNQIINFPNSSILFNILGAVLADQGQFDKAIESYKKAIKINSNYAQAYNNLGIVLHKLNKINEAIDNYKKAISLKIDFAEALNNLGNGMREINKQKNALEYFKQAIQINPDYAEAYNNLGATYNEIGNQNEALNNFKNAIKVKPDYAEAYNNLGMVFNDQLKFEESLLNYNKAIKAKPYYEKSYNNLANLLSNLGKYDEATATYRHAIKIKPDYAKAYSNLLFNLNYKLDFDSGSYLLEAKKFRINCGPKEKPQMKYQYLENPKKLKLGLVSADFGNHPGGFHTLSTLRELKKKNFELIAYVPINRKDEFSHHFRQLFSKWHLIEKKNDKDVVEQIFNDGIHILIDLQGHSAKNRLPIFMYKAAPIQVSWLAQGSTGIPEIDYFVGSPIIIPKNEENHYVEKVWRLPEITQCFTPPDFDVKINNLPALSNNFITFGCVNKLTKVNDDVIALWSKILLSISNSKLLLKNRDLDNQKVVNETFARFEKHNVKKDRLILKGKSNTRKELLETYNEIDIALDPFPFQGNTSTEEAVWMGVPVVTLKGNRYLFHFGESLNYNLDMKDWIAKNEKDYVFKTLKFSSNIDELSKIRRNLRQKALQSPVFDAPRFTKHFSKMLWDMWNNFCKKK